MKTGNQMAQMFSAQLGEKRAAAELAWAHFEALRAEAAKLGPEIFNDKNKALVDKLSWASDAYDGATQAVASAESTMARVGQVLMDPDGYASGPATLDVEAFVSSVSAWAGSLSALDLGDTIQRMPMSPSFTLMKGRDVRAALTSSSPTQFPARRAGVVTLPAPPLSLLDLIPIVPVEADEVEIVRETTYTPAAVETAEGAEAPEATIGYVKESVWCKNIAVYLAASKQVITEPGRLRQFVSERLMRAVRERLQTQAVKGDGIDPNLLGLTNWSGTLTHAQGADSVLADVILKAKIKVIIETKGAWQPQTLLINPLDFQDLALQKDAGASYYLGTPTAAGLAPWGLAPVLTLDVEEGTPIVLDATAAEIYLNGDVNVTISDSHEGQFRRGIISFVASGRFVLEVLEPKAFCAVQLGV